MYDQDEKTYYGVNDLMNLGKFKSWRVGDVISTAPAYVKNLVATSWFGLDDEAEELLETYCCEGE